MAGVVGVRFQRAGKVRYFNPGRLILRVNDYVVLEGPQGPQVGWVVIAPDQILFSKVKGPLPAILRKAEPGDMTSMEQTSPDND